MKEKRTRTQKGQAIIDLNEDQSRAYLEKLLWPDGPVCPHCGSKSAHKMQGKTVRAGLYRCRDCVGQYTCTIGTIFEDSHLPISKWLKGFHLMCSSKKGISAMQLQRNLGLGSYSTAWFMCHRIRKAMQQMPALCTLGGTIEVDETYVGGKVKGKGHKAGRDNKTPVVSLVQRDGKKRSFVMKKVTAENLRAAVMSNVTLGAEVHTDEHLGYQNLRIGFKHRTVNHSKGEYAWSTKDGSRVTTNTVESSFALLKRGIIGAFHHISPTHLHRYCAEFDFRWNHRHTPDVERTAEALKASRGKRLVYGAPDKKLMV
jgi:transposase-like protein